MTTNTGPSSSSSAGGSQGSSKADPTCWSQVEPSDSSLTAITGSDDHSLDPTEGHRGQVDDDSDYRDLERSHHGKNDVSPCLQRTHRMIDSVTNGQLSSLCGSNRLTRDAPLEQQEAHQQGLGQGQPEQEPLAAAVRSAQALPPPPSLPGPRRPRPTSVRNVSYKRPRHANAQLRREGVEDDEERKLGATVRRHAGWWW